MPELQTNQTPMRTYLAYVIYSLLFLLFSPQHLNAGSTVHNSDQTDSSSTKKNKNFIGDISDNLVIKGQWFLNYKYCKTSEIEMNSFSINRGYLTFKKELSPVFSARLTSDITVDEEGDGRGDIEVRLKYVYLKTKLPELFIFTHSYIECGLVHRPWIDFEQKINPYRVQGQMFIERYHITGSADFGITYTSLIGGKIDKEYQNEISKSYPGKYGSISIGLYNGGGYHAIEENRNKTFESRLSLRPLPALLPGLQFSYHGIIGRGNTRESPECRVSLGMMSYETKYAVLAAQYITGKGDISGEKLAVADSAFNNSGYSVFGELKIPETSFTVFGRFDHFETELENVMDRKNTVILGGIGYYFTSKSIIVVDVDYELIESPGTREEEISAQISVEINF